MIGNLQTPWSSQRLKRFFGALLLVLAEVGSASSADELIVVVGAGGEPMYADQFAETAKHWLGLSQHNGWRLTTIGPISAKASSGEIASSPQDTSAAVAIDATDRDRLRAVINHHLERQQTTGERVILVLIGHGTYQPGTAKFNLVGPDVSASELALWLRGTSIAGPANGEVTANGDWVIVNGASCSGPFLEALSGPSRTVVTATRSGEEINVPRFGRFFVEVLLDSTSDLDHDGRTSILEAFLAASSRTQQSYEQEGRLQTEHALIDDNGDQRGTSREFFRGTRVVQTSRGEATPDGARARYQILRKGENEAELSEEATKELEALLAEVERIRGEKATLTEAEYYLLLEPILIRIATIEEERIHARAPRPAEQNRQE